MIVKVMVVIVMMMLFVLLVLFVFWRLGWMMVVVIVIIVGRILSFHSPVAAHRAAGGKSDNRNDKQCKPGSCNSVNSSFHNVN